MFCSRLAERGVKNTTRRSMGVGRALTCFAPEPQACREGSEKHCWGGGGGGGRWSGLSSEVPIDLSTPDVA